MLYKLHGGLAGQRSRRAWAADFVRAFIFSEFAGGTYFCPIFEDNLLYSFFTSFFAAVDVFSTLPFFIVLYLFFPYFFSSAYD